MTDIAQALSGSLSRDGQGGMRAPLDMGSFKLTNLADGTNDSDGATVGQSGRDVGELADFPLPPPPTGKWLLRDGSAISRTTYAALFAYLGTAFGPGDGSTTFNLPDARGRVDAGKDDMGGTAANRLTGFGLVQAGAGGTETVTLTEGQMPAHGHGVNDPGHAHDYTRSAGFAPPGPDGSTSSQSGTAATSPSGTGITIASTGGGQAHPNVQPTSVVYKCIRAFR